MSRKRKYKSRAKTRIKQKKGGFGGILLLLIILGMIGSCGKDKSSDNKTKTQHEIQKKVTNVAETDKVEDNDENTSDETPEISINISQEEKDALHLDVNVPGK